MVYNVASFESQSKRFFDGELMRMIYRSKEICVCNVANQCYVAFNYYELDGIQYGYMGGWEFVEFVVASPARLDEYIVALGKENFSNYLLPLTDDAFEVVSKIKQNNDIHGPTKSINFAGEEKITRLWRKQAKKFKFFRK